MPLSIKSYIVCNLLLKLSGRGVENILLELAVHEIHEYKFRIGFLLLCIHYSLFWREGEGGKLNIILPSVHLKSSLIRVMAFDESGLRRVELLCTIFREFHGSFQTTKKPNVMIMLHHIYGWNPWIYVTTKIAILPQPWKSVSMILMYSYYMKNNTFLCLI